MRRVLVTGASGFIGQRLLKYLYSSGLNIRATSLSNKPEYLFDSIECLQKDLMDEDSDLRCLCKDCDAIVHLAGLAHQPGSSWAKYRLTNTKMTQRLAMTAATCNVSHFIFMSTAKVFGEGYPPSGKRQYYADSDVANPEGGYATSKLAAEEELYAIGLRTGMRCTLLRPPLVYGPGVKGNFAQLLRVVEKGVPLPLASVNNQRSFIFVDNLCHLIGRLLDSPIKETRMYCVADAAMSTPEMIRAMAKAISVSPRLFPFPPSLLRLAGRITGRHGIIERLTQSFVINDSVIRRDLDWVPPVSLEEGMKITAEWFLNKAGKNIRDEASVPVVK